MEEIQHGRGRPEHEYTEMEVLLKIRQILKEMRTWSSDMAHARAGVKRHKGSKVFELVKNHRAYRYVVRRGKMKDEEKYIGHRNQYGKCQTRVDETILRSAYGGN